MEIRFIQEKEIEFYGTIFIGIKGERRIKNKN